MVSTEPKATQQLSCALLCVVVFFVVVVVIVVVVIVVSLTFMVFLREMPGKRIHVELCVWFVFVFCFLFVVCQTNRDKQPSVLSGLELHVSAMAERGKKKHNDWTMLQPSHVDHPGQELHLSSNKFSVR
jgi:hypothetical protein